MFMSLICHVRKLRGIVKVEIDKWQWDAIENHMTLMHWKYNLELELKLGKQMC